jgi:hypothetical protein
MTPIHDPRCFEGSSEVGSLRTVCPQSGPQFSDQGEQANQPLVMPSTRLKAWPHRTNSSP